MKIPVWSNLSRRTRSVTLVIAGLVLFVSAAWLYASTTLWSAPPPAYHPVRTMPNTDVNPYGANLFLEREVEAWKRERTVGMARDAGIGWGRQEFIWAEIEPEPGIFNWTKYDEIVDLLRRNNIQVIARLDRPPAWARSRASGTGASGPPDDYEAYGRFVSEFAKRYQGKVHYLQIWNEPNLGREWNDEPIDPAAYTRLLKIAYESAKAVDPNFRILSAPLAITLGEAFTSGSEQYRNMNDLQFLEEMYAAGAAAYFDILSANAFGLGSPPDDPPNPGTLNFQRVRLEREVMEANGDAHKPIWILEYGWNAAPDSIPDSRLVWGRVSEQEQALYTVRGIELAHNEWDWVGVASIWFFRQVGDIPPSNPEAYFRMVDVDFTPRPVHFSVRQATQAQRVAGPGQYQETNPAVQLDPSWMYEFTGAASGEQYARAEAGARATLRFYGEGIDLIARRSPNDGRLLLTLDGQPVSLLPRTESGQSIVELNGNADEWQVTIPVARNLPRGEHVVELVAEGDVNLDGMRVPEIPATQPPWLVIGILTSMGLVSMAWAVGLLLRR